MNIDPNSNTALASKVRAMMDKTNSDIQSTRSDTENTGRKASEDIRQKKVNQALMQTKDVLKILDNSTLFSYPIPESKTKGESFSNADLGALANKFQGEGAASLTNAFVAALLEIIENMLNSATNVIDLQQKSFAQTSSALIAAGSMAETSMNMANSTLIQANSAARTQFLSSVVGLASSAFGLASLAKQSVTPKAMTENLQQFKSKFGMDKATDAEFAEFAKNMKTADREDLIKSLHSVDPDLADRLQQHEVKRGQEYAHEKEVLSQEVKGTLDFVTEHQKNPSAVSKKLDEFQTVVGQDQHKRFVAEAGKPDAMQKFTWSHEKNRLTVHGMNVATKDQLLAAGLISKHNISASASGTFSCELNTMIKTRSISDPADSSGATTFEEVHYLRQSEIDPSKFEYTVLTAKRDLSGNFAKNASGAIEAELKFQPELDVNLCDKVTKEGAVFDTPAKQNEELKRFAEKMTDISIMRDVSVSKRVHDALEKHETSGRFRVDQNLHTQSIEKNEKLKERHLEEIKQIQDDIATHHDVAIQNTQATIDTKQAEIDAKQTEITTKQADIVNKQADIATKQVDIVTKQAEIDARKQKTKTDIEAIKKETNDQIIRHGQRIEAKEKLIRRLEISKVNKNDAEKAAIQTQIDQKKTELETLKTERDRLSLEVDLKIKECHDLGAQGVGQLSREKHDLETHLAQLKTDLHQAETELEQLKVQHQNATNEKEALVSTRIVKEQNKSKLEKNVVDLKKRIVNCDQEIAEIRGLIATETQVISVKDKLSEETVRALENYVHAEQQDAGLKSIDKIFEEKNRSTHIGQDTDYQRLHEIVSKVTTDADASLQRMTTITQFTAPGLITFGSGIMTQQAQMNDALSRNTATQAQAIQGQNDAALKLLQQTASDLLNSSTTCLEKLLEAILSAFSAAQKALESR